jgi:hypothetical protein
LATGHEAGAPLHEAGAPYRERHGATQGSPPPRRVKPRWRLAHPFAVDTGVPQVQLLIHVSALPEAAASAAAAAARLIPRRRQASRRPQGVVGPFVAAALVAQQPARVGPRWGVGFGEGGVNHM